MYRVSRKLLKTRERKRRFRDPSPSAGPRAPGFPRNGFRALSVRRQGSCARPLTPRAVRPPSPGRGPSPPVSAAIDGARDGSLHVVSTSPRQRSRRRRHDPLDGELKKEKEEKKRSYKRITAMHWRSFPTKQLCSLAENPFSHHEKKSSPLP